MPLSAPLLSPVHPGSRSAALGPPEPSRLLGVIESGGSPLPSAGNALVSGSDAAKSEGRWVGIAVQPASGAPRLAPLQPQRRLPAPLPRSSDRWQCLAVRPRAREWRSERRLRASTASRAALSDLRVGTGDIGSFGATLLVVVAGWPVVAVSGPAWSVAVWSADIAWVASTGTKPPAPPPGLGGHWPRPLILAHDWRSMSASRRRSGRLSQLGGGMGCGCPAGSQPGLE